MSEDKETAGEPKVMTTGGGTIRLCTGQGIIYKAYKRPYAGGGANVLTLLASCSYPEGPWEIFFTPVYGDSSSYELMEKVPHIFYNLVTFYAASYCSHLGLPELKDSVVVIDSFGRHDVAVEPFS